MGALVFLSPRYLITFIVVINICLKTMAAASDTTTTNFAFSFKNFGKDSNFESRLALYGDAKVANHSMLVQIAGSRVSSAGRLICKEPINLVQGRTKNSVSFSSYFTFSMSGESGDGLAFVMLPVEFPLKVFDGGSMGLLRENKMKFLAVEFDVFKDDQYGDVNNNHVGLDIESLVSVKSSNASSANLVLNSSVKLQSWIDYEASGKRIEVRLSKFGDIKPLEPLLSYPIDLSRMWGDEDFYVGLSSSSGNSSQKVNVYSWSFSLRTPLEWMHSEPLDPDTLLKREEDLRIPKRNNCTSRIIVALVFGAGCGVLGAFFVLVVWVIIGNKRPVVPEEFVGKVKEFEYKKFNDEKTIKDGEKK